MSGARSARRAPRAASSSFSSTTSRPSRSAFMNGGKSPRRGSRPGAGHHPEVDVARGRDALLEHQAGLDERLQRQSSRSARRRARRRPRAGLAVLVEAVAAGLGAELARSTDRACLCMACARDVEAGLAITSYSSCRCSATCRTVSRPSRSMRMNGPIGATLRRGDLRVDLLDREPLLLLGAPQLSRPPS